MNEPNNGSMNVHGMEWLPSDPPRIAPSLMTAQEAVVYLRLDEGGRDMADALKSLEYLVLSGRLRPCRVGRHNRFARAELQRFVLEQTERYGRDKAGSKRPQPHLDTIGGQP